MVRFDRKFARFGHFTVYSKASSIFGKKKLLNYALLLNIIGLLALLFVPPSNVYLILFCRLIAAAGSLTAGDICGRLFLKQ